METSAPINALIDKGSFLQIECDPACGITAAFASIASRPVTMLIFGAAIKGARAAHVMEVLLQKTLQTGTPLIMVFTENETSDDMKPIWAVLPQIIRLSGVCPIISLSLREEGIVANSFLPYADFCIFAEGIHENTASNIQAVDHAGAVEKLRSLLYSLPLNCAENVPNSECDSRKVKHASGQYANPAARIADAGSVIEIYKDSHVHVAFIRACGKNAAVISSANGSIPHHTTRFIQFCDCYSIPLIVIAEDILTLSALQMFMLSQATSGKILFGETSNGSSVFDFVFSKQSHDDASTREKAARSIECLSVKRDVLPPHKHGNLPL